MGEPVDTTLYDEIQKITCRYPCKHPKRKELLLELMEKYDIKIVSNFNLPKGIQRGRQKMVRK